MATPGGTITRKDLITDEGINWGPEYAKNLNIAIEANGKLVSSAKELSSIVNSYRKVTSQNAFLEEKQKESVALIQATNAIKQEEAAMISLNKIKISSIAAIEAERKAKQAATDAEIKSQKAKQSTVKLTVEERVQNELNNRVLKQEALERLGLVSAYTKLNKSRTDAKNNLRDLIASEKASTAELKKAQKEFDTLDKKVRLADKAVGDFTKNVGNYPYKTMATGLRDLVGAFGLIGGVTAFASVTKSIYNTTKELQSLDLALKSVTGTQQEFQEQQLFLTTISGKYGLEIKNLTKQFISFYVAAKDKLAGNEIQEIFENISKSGSALGLSNETLERSFQAVNQMLSKGTVVSEELRGQLAESMPGAVQAMTKAVQKLHPEIKNLTEKGLFQMIKDGKILAEEVLPETSRQLVLLTGADKAQGIETLTKLTNRLSNDWTDMIRSINETDSSGFGIFVKDIVSGLSTILQFTGLLFKNEKQLTEYFVNLGKQKGLEEYQAIMQNIATTSKENQELVKKELLLRERENIRINQNIIKAEKEKRESILGGDRALFHLQTKIEEDALVKIGKSAAIIKKINNSIKPAEEKEAKETVKKANTAPKPTKAKVDDSLYQLEKQRLELSVSINNEIVKDDEETDAIRIAAVENRLKKETALLDLNKKQEFKKNEEIFKNSVEFAKAQRDYNLQNEKLTADDKLKIENEYLASLQEAKSEKLNNNDLTRINEKYAYDLVQIKKKASEEIDKINEFDLKSYQDNLDEGVKKQEIAMNAELSVENERFAALGDLEKMSQKDREKAIEDHERKIFDIKKEFAIATAKLQADNLEAELNAYKAQSDGSAKSNAVILDIEKKLSDARLKLTELGIDNFKAKETDKVKTAKEALEEIFQVSSDMTDALADLASAFNERKIQEIDEQISKNNEYYDKQIEGAKNDDRQKALLEEERKKKNDELEKKKRKEQEKQAKFEKAATITKIALQTALAIITAAAATAPTFWGVAIAAGIGAIQLGAALASPIPKYKMGRNGGPAEFAEVGDGFVNEVIEKKDGRTFLTPNRPTLTFLDEGDKVHSSVDHYKKMQRAAMLSSIDMQGRKMSNYQAQQNFDSHFDQEILNELKETRKVLKNQKTNIQIHNNIDIPHSIWKSKNTNWSN